MLKFRLYDIDRVLSRTLAYAVVTGLVVGAYVGIITLVTRVLGFSSPVAVAASTLAAVALFNPVRVRVQRVSSIVASTVHATTPRRPLQRSRPGFGTLSIWRRCGATFSQSSTGLSSLHMPRCGSAVQQSPTDRTPTACTSVTANVASRSAQHELSEDPPVLAPD